MQVRTAFPRKVTEVADMGIVLPDGCRLSARVWMPDDALADPVPAVLEYIPYRKRDGTLARDELMHPYMAGHGYACVRVDIRGNGDSDGLMTDEYTPQELQDACAVIAWLAAQPWCSGRVGMMGKSWGAFNSLQVAALRPPALAAVVSVYGTVDRFADDIHFKGGCLLGENFGWGSVMLSYSSRPPDPALRDDWRAAWMARLRAEPFLAPVWAGHQARDAYWRHGSVCEDWAALGVPVLAVGGWADNYMNMPAQVLEKAQGTAQAIMGPWVHQYPHTAVPAPQVGFLQVMLRWWDRWLKVLANGAEADPSWRGYVLDSAPPDASAAARAGTWLALPSWPPAGATEAVLALGPGGRLGAAASPDVTVATPQHLGLAAGEFFPMGLNAEMPGDQRGDDALSVCFDAEPAVGAQLLLGRARLRLRLVADRPRALIAARLCDVAPDGASVRIAHGMLNLCHRDGADRPRLLVPGVAVEVEFALDQMAYRLAPGHHLRLALSTTYWPFVWPSPEAATLRLLSGALHLPLHDGTGAEWDPPTPETAQPARLTQIGVPHAARRIERDLIGGRVALVVEEDTGMVRNEDHGLVTGESVAERWEIDPGDPLSAVATIRWEQRLERGDWRVRTLAETRMTGTATQLRMTARLTAWEGGQEVWSRDWDESVPRDFV
jgi:hypothetical protein